MTESHREQEVADFEGRQKVLSPIALEVGCVDGPIALAPAAGAIVCRYWPVTGSGAHVPYNELPHSAGEVAISRYLLVLYWLVLVALRLLSHEVHYV
jgi:hypothetical protein